MENPVGQRAGKDIGSHHGSDGRAEQDVTGPVGQKHDSLKHRHGGQCKKHITTTGEHPGESQGNTESRRTVARRKRLHQVLGIPTRQARIVDRRLPGVRRQLGHLTIRLGATAKDQVLDEMDCYAAEQEAGQQARYLSRVCGGQCDHQRHDDGYTKPVGEDF